MKALHALAICFVAGCSPTKVEPLALLEGQRTVTLLQGDKHLIDTKVEIPVDDLPNILARATWIDDAPFHKGGNWVRFSRGKDILIPYVLNFVIVRDTKGYFLIRPEDRKRYEELAKRIHTKANKTHHPTASSRSVSMISGN